MKSVIGCLLCATLLLVAAPAPAHALPSPEAIDAEAVALMQRTGARGMAVAVIDRGRVVHVQAFGQRNAQGDPLTVDTVMYGASLTKTVFAYTVMRWVDAGKLDLDAPIAGFLPRPLPEYGGEDIVRRYTDWTALDERWRRLTPRMLLNHASGFANFNFLEPDGKLHFHFDPGSRYAYSGDGLATLQFVLERGLGLDVGQGTDAVFADLGMKRTALRWRADFAGNLADGWDIDGKPEPHDERSRVRRGRQLFTRRTVDCLQLDARRIQPAAERRGDQGAPAEPELLRRDLHNACRWIRPETAHKRGRL